MLAINLATGDDITQESKHPRHGQKAIAPGAREKSDGQPEVRRQAPTPAVEQGRLSSVNLAGDGPHGVWNYLEEESETAPLDR